MFIGCKSSNTIFSRNCKSYINLITEFSNKFEELDNRCLVFNFERDSTRFISYNEFNGKSKFMDYKLNEVLYYQHNLTNEFGDLDSISLNCQKKINKVFVTDCFGENYTENEFTNELSYNVCNSGQTSNLNYLNFKFDKNGYLKYFIINIYQF